MKRTTYFCDICGAEAIKNKHVSRTTKVDKNKNARMGIEIFVDLKDDEGKQIIADAECCLCKDCQIRAMEILIEELREK